MIIIMIVIHLLIIILNHYHDQLTTYHHHLHRWWEHAGDKILPCWLLTFLHHGWNLVMVGISPDHDDDLGGQVQGELFTPDENQSLFNRWVKPNQTKPNQTKPMIMTMMFRRFPAWEDESWRALEAGQPKTRAGGFWWKLCWFCCSIIVIVTHIPHQCGWQWCRQWPLKMLKI